MPCLGCLDLALVLALALTLNLALALALLVPGQLGNNLKQI